MTRLGILADIHTGNDAFVIRDYLGHRSVSTTNIYVASSPARFDRVWR